MKVTFASWNVSWKGGMTPAKIAVVTGTPWHLLALQEVTVAGYDALVAGLTKAKIYRWSAFSLDHLPPIPGDMASGLGCAIFSREPAAGTDPKFKLLSSYVLKKAPLPRRTLIVEATSPKGPILKVCSFHVPDWSGWGEAKPETQRRITRWLGKHGKQVLVGMDVNGPEIDYPHTDPVHSKFYFAEEWDLLAPNRAHNLRDTLRVLLMGKPDAMAAIKRARPNGPLKISFKQGAKEYRYDHIYATPDFDVLDVDYQYGAATAAGSDHALVVAQLELPEY